MGQSLMTHKNVPNVYNAKLIAPQMPLMLKLILQKSKTKDVYFVGFVKKFALKELLRPIGSQ